MAPSSAGLDWHAVSGSFDDGDAAALRSLLAQVPEGGATAHVGIFEGRHLAACHEVIRERRLSIVAVDIWQPLNGTRSIYGGEPGDSRTGMEINWPAVAINFGRVTALFDFGCGIEVISLSSLHAAQASRLAGKAYDLVFLDADHTYEFVLADIMAWKPLLRPGGILCGHDWGQKDHPGVEQAVRRLLPGAACVPGSTVWWRKAPQEVGL